MSLKPAKIENYSGYYFNWHGKISPLRKGYYLVIEDKSVGGDAPKDFIKVYEYGAGLRSRPYTWTAYINHFKLIELLFKNDKRYCDVCRELLNFEKLNAVIDLLDREFAALMSIERRQIIERCLTLRYEQLNEVL